MARVSIEDCLKYMENRFALVAVASHRTRELMNGRSPLVRAKNKEAVIALREIANGLVGVDPASRVKVPVIEEPIATELTAVAIPEDSVSEE